MKRAVNNWVKVEVKNDQKGFMVAESSLLEGTVISSGVYQGKDGIPYEHFKKGETVLFPSQHGKVMEHAEGGKKYYFVDKDLILEHE